MGGSKGAHLVVENPALHKALNGHMVYFGTADGRVNLAYPFMGQVLLGATDIKIDDPDAAVCDDEEADYLRGVVSEIFPDIPVTADQIRHRFSGVRPLPRADGDIGMVTRDHSIAEEVLPGGTPVLCLIGGKWTTFRGFSEQISTRILKMLGRARHRSTAAMQIGGGKDYPAPDQRAGWVRKHAGVTGLSTDRMETLFGRYGTRAAEIAGHLGPDCPLQSLPDYSREELAYLIRHERVGDVDDLLCRRTTIAISGALSFETRREVEALYEACQSAAMHQVSAVRDEVVEV
jgi:glycerol-3-phosphate dehydrogenase